MSILLAKNKPIASNFWPKIDNIWAIRHSDLYIKQIMEMSCTGLMTIYSLVLGKWIKKQNSFILQFIIQWSLKFTHTLYFAHVDLCDLFVLICLTSRNDYGVRSLESILDMVKVMSFALTKGKVIQLHPLLSELMCNSWSPIHVKGYREVFKQAWKIGVLSILQEETMMQPGCNLYATVDPWKIWMLQSALWLV